MKMVRIIVQIDLDVSVEVFNVIHIGATGTKISTGELKNRDFSTEVVIHVGNHVLLL